MLGMLVCCSNMRTCVRLCLCLSPLKYAHVRASVSMRTCVCLCLCLSPPTSACGCGCLSGCVRARVRVRMCVFVCVCVCSRACEQEDIKYIDAVNELAATPEDKALLSPHLLQVSLLPLSRSSLYLQTLNLFFRLSLARGHACARFPFLSRSCSLARARALSLSLLFSLLFCFRSSQLSLFSFSTLALALLFRNSCSRPSLSQLLLVTQSLLAFSPSVCSRLPHLASY